MEHNLQNENSYNLKRLNILKKENISVSIKKIDYSVLSDLSL